MVWRAVGSPIWDKYGMSLPKEIIPKSISSMSGSFVLGEGVLDNLLALKAASIHERR